MSDQDDKQQAELIAKAISDKFHNELMWICIVVMLVTGGFWATVGFFFEMFLWFAGIIGSIYLLYKIATNFKEFLKVTALIIGVVTICAILWTCVHNWEIAPERQEERRTEANQQYNPKSNLEVRTTEYKKVFTISYLSETEKQYCEYYRQQITKGVDRRDTSLEGLNCARRWIKSGLIQGPT